MEGYVTKNIAAASAEVCLAPLRFDIDDRDRPEGRHRHIPVGAWTAPRNLTC